MFRSRLNVSQLITTSRSRFSTVVYPKIEASIRSYAVAGSRKSRALREQGLVPGVLYGTDEDGNVLKSMITVDKKLLGKEILLKGKCFENTVYEMEVKGETGSNKCLVTPRQAQFNALTDELLSVNFLRYYPGNRLRIPIEFVNADQSQDVKRGCFVVRVNKFIECVCDEEVPATIKVDLSGAQKGDVFRVNALNLPEKVRPAKTVPPDYVLCVVKASKSSK